MKTMCAFFAAAVLWIGAAAISIGGTVSIPFPGPGGIAGAPACTPGGSDSTNTIYLAHLDTNAANSATSGISSSFSGSAVASTSQKVFGAGSMSLPNTSGSDFVITPTGGGGNAAYGFSTGQFSFDFWWRAITTQQSALVSDSDNGEASLDVEWVGASLRIQLAAGPLRNFTLTSTALNTWTWIFFGRDSGGTINAFQSSGGAGSSVNTLAGAVADAGSLGTSRGYQFGQRATGATQLNGFMDEVRIRKVYTAPGATAPALPYC